MSRERTTFDRINVYMARTVLAGAAGSDQFRIPRVCTVESMAVRFYQGAQNELLLVPELRSPTGDRVPLVAYAGADQFIAGNDDYFEFDIILPAWRGWILHLDYSNISAVDLDYRVKFALDMENGDRRARYE